MKQLIQKKLAWGVVVMVVSGTLGMLPALDFMPANYLKIVSFLLGIALLVAKGIEMFFDQSAQLESKTDENYIKSNSQTGVVETGTRQTTTTTPTEPPKL